MKHLQNVWQLSSSDSALTDLRGLLSDGMGGWGRHTRKTFFCCSLSDVLPRLGLASRLHMNQGLALRELNGACYALPNQISRKILCCVWPPMNSPAPSTALNTRAGGIWRA